MGIKSKDVRIINGYRYIKCSNHPFANSQGFVCEHRLIAEKYLLNDDNSVVIDGKSYLSKKCVIHHIDFNKLNNDYKNLIVMDSSEHMRMHNKLYDNTYFLNYCRKFNLEPDIVRKTRSDFKHKNYKKYI